MPGSARTQTRLVIAYLLFVTLALLIAYPYFEGTRNANERPRLLQGVALVEHGELAIDGPAVRAHDPGPDVARSQTNGRLYPNKPPGPAVLAAAAYVIGDAFADPLTLRGYTWWARLLGGIAPTVLVCGFLFTRYAGSLGRGPVALAVALYVFGTPASSYAHLFYGHQLSACLLTIGVVWVSDGLTEERPSRAALGGLVAAAAVAVDYGTVFAAVPIAVVLLAHARARRGPMLLAASVGGALAAIALLGAYHASAFGSPWSTGYHHVTNASFAAKHGQGLLGLSWPRFSALYTHLLSPDGGLLWWAPLFPLGLYGLARLGQVDGRHRREARVQLGAFVVLIIVAAGLSFEGGWRVGPRYLVPVLPFLVLGWAHVFATMRQTPWRLAALGALATYSVAVNSLAASLWPHFDLTNIHQPVAEVLLPLVAGGFEPYSLPGWLVGLDGSALAVLLPLVGVGVVLFRWAEPGRGPRTWLGVGAAAGIGLVAATQVVPAHPRGQRNLAYIVREWEPKPGSAAAIPSVPVRTSEIERRRSP